MLSLGYLLSIYCQFAQLTSSLYLFRRLCKREIRKNEQAERRSNTEREWEISKYDRNAGLTLISGRCALGIIDAAWKYPRTGNRTSPPPNDSLIALQALLFSRRHCRDDSSRYTHISILISPVEISPLPRKRSNIHRRRWFCNGVYSITANTSARIVGCSCLLSYRPVKFIAVKLPSILLCIFFFFHRVNLSAVTCHSFFLFPFFVSALEVPSM